MKKPVLVIMAAGLGSRYGGMKQIDPVDREGHVIMDFSMFDAKRAGFEKVVCIIKKSMEEDFDAVIGSRIKPYLDIKYAFQDINDIPEGYSVPEGRIKPWGTAHAVLSAREQIGDAPMAVINADDFYGREAFLSIFQYLSEEHHPGEYAMVGYLLKNTVTDYGHVARGVCSVSKDGILNEINERLRIEKKGAGKIAYTEDEGASYTELDPDTIVSMNFWGFDHTYLEEAEKRFPLFLDKNLPINPLKCEYLLPRVTDELVIEGKATVKVLSCGAKWFGVTYKEDMPGLQKAIAEMKAKGLYPDRLWK